MATLLLLASNLKVNLFIWLLFLGTALTTPTDEIQGLANHGELTYKNTPYLRQIVLGNPSQELQRKDNTTQLSEIVDKDNEYYKIFKKCVDQGYAKRGLTFNIYNDNMRETAIALFRLLKYVDEDDFPKVRHWAIQNNINEDLFEYAWRLSSLYYNKFGMKEMEPHFITKPNYYINGEAIRKALMLKMDHGHFNPQESKVNQFYRTDNVVTINTNYSGWNLPRDACVGKLNYFLEDIALSSYYYGVQLLHPFWMSNEELDELNPKHAEHCFFVHRQLLARYILEKENLPKDVKNCYEFSNPYLVYDNGLPFPIRSTIAGDRTERKSDIASRSAKINEYIKSGIVVMDNGTTIILTEDNYVDLLTKLIRENFDGIKTAKYVKSLAGHGRNGYPEDEYNPAPSLLHHAETSLKAAAYWGMIEVLSNYFNQFTNSFKPYNLSEYETEEFNILDASYSNITTYFNYYQFDINKAVKSYDYCDDESTLILTARQKRLNHLHVGFNFTIDSKNTRNAVLRIYLGPSCHDNCWTNFSTFFQLDAYTVLLKKGINHISWSPDTSSALSDDDSFNKEVKFERDNKYNIFKFPKNLLIPKGSEEGRKATLFVMLTPADTTEHDNDSKINYYRLVSYEIDNKPLGFPFHRQASNYKNSASNYKFYNVAIYHERRSLDNSGYFSDYLY